MPSPSTTKRSSSRRDNKTPPSQSKPVDVGVPLGIYDTNSVRDRVRQWQSQGGGVITEPDICVDDEEEDKISCRDLASRGEDADKASKSYGMGLYKDEPKSSPKRHSRRKAKADEEPRDRTRSGSAPAKRVVSDAHWRIRRSPPRSATSSTTPKNTPQGVFLKENQLSDGIRIKPISEPKVDLTHDDRPEAIIENIGGDGGIRVFSTAPGSHKESKNLQTPQRDGASGQSAENSDIEVVRFKISRSHSSQSNRENKHPTRERPPRLGSSAAKEQARRRRSSHHKEKVVDTEPLFAQRGFSEGRGSAKSQTANILSQVFGEPRRIFSKTQPPLIPPLRAPIIEAWLSETSDPFIDENEPTVDIISVLGDSPKSKVAIEEKKPVRDPNDIWDSVGPRPGTRATLNGSKRRKRIRSAAIYEDNPFSSGHNSRTPTTTVSDGTIPATKLVDLVQVTLEASPTSLKRRGAKKSSSSSIRDRRKSFDVDRPTINLDKASAVSSNATASSVEGPDPTTPLRPPGLNFKRPFPSTGQHRLSTIASVETFNTKAQNAPPSVLSENSEATAQTVTNEKDGSKEEARDGFDPNSLSRSTSRLTKHADLISVLSLPRAGNKSIQSARSIRTNRSRLTTATIGDLMKELVMDESKYMRELRTLVDGVIPVLLTCVLSKSDSAVAAGLFRPSMNASEDPNFTRPIVDMGIALERLKTLHKRVPYQDASALLTWAQGAQRVYAEYLKAWRMGFQDVVVNLAPSTGIDLSNPRPLDGNSDELDEGLPRNQDGDVVNGDGERVDVAFLLKRPLVRLKYLAKTLKGINFLNPSPEAETLASKYQNLVIDARNRSNEERARLEDEAASNVDATRARDPRTLAPLTGVTIDKTRHVRARDHFNLALQHSSGQRMDCQVELLLRDDSKGAGTAGDFLICEIDSTGRWLLFPPIQFSRVSARNGDLKGEIVVMIRGLAGNGQEWQELLSLQSDNEQAGFEWVQMLGLTPVPPKITRSQSFLGRHTRKPSSERSAAVLDLSAISIDSGKSRTPSPREIEIPIGEQSSQASKTWTDKLVDLATAFSPVLSSPKDRARLQRKSLSSPPSTPSKPPQNYVDEVNDLRTLPSQSQNKRLPSPDRIQTPIGLNEPIDPIKSTSPSSLRRTKAKRLSRPGNGSAISPRLKRPSDVETDAQISISAENAEVPASSSPDPGDVRSQSPEPRLDYGPSSQTAATHRQKDSNRPAQHRSRSSVPSMELPIIPKVRKDSPPTTPINEPDEEIDWDVSAERAQSLLSPELTEKRPISLKTKSEDSPISHVPSSGSPLVDLKGSKTPILDTKTSRNAKRRSSSPLKHEYEPSTASETLSDSDTSTVERNEVTSISDSSEDEELEDGDAPTPLLPLGITQRISKVFPQSSIHSLPNGTLSPSQSASQAPYKTVPSQPTKASKTIASIFSWSDKGSWDSLHPDECSIVITPGLIAAYEMSATHSKNIPHSSSTPVTDADVLSDLSSHLDSPNEDPQQEQPLVALELTPLVPLRRGTALDISIRSPPTANSQITSGNNIMFRSRNPEECEALYALINHSRINNPTYVALQNARGPYVAGISFPPSLDRRSSTRASSSRASSWFGGLGRSSSYRASSVPTPSIAPSESSIGSMASAFSALKRFGKGSGGMFNIARSTISSRNGSRANSVYTSSENSSGSGTSSPIPPPNSDSIGKAAPIGLSNAKIRLYIRETASRWRDMGSARLTIMSPMSPQTLIPGVGRNEKRIVVNGKTKGEVLLDVQLGESCFERVARTGIALSVWEEVVGPNGEIGVVGAVGGVGGGRARVYMIQVYYIYISILLNLHFRKVERLEAGKWKM